MIISQPVLNLPVLMRISSVKAAMLTEFLRGFLRNVFIVIGRTVMWRQSANLLIILIPLMIVKVVIQL